jgi:hypothetical protein
LTHQIIFDFLSLLPLTIAILDEINEKNIPPDSTIHISPLNKLFLSFFAYKSFSLEKFMRRLDESFPTSETLGYGIAFFKLIMILLMTNHIFSTIWIILGRYE